jgi:hypothetical protein
VVALEPSPRKVGEREWRGSHPPAPGRRDRIRGNADVANPASIEIALGDIALRIAVGTEPTYIASLIAALRARC